MDKSKLILIIPALFVMGFIVVHSLRVNGPALTRKFFFWSFLYCYTKEFINAHSRQPEYFSSGLELFGTPMMVPFGWVISIYLSWFLAECILCPRGRNPAKVISTVGLSSMIIACISFMVECSGGNMGWWQWNYSVPGLWHENALLKMPVKIIGGWATTNLIFMAFFMVYAVSPWREVKRKALKITAVFLAFAVPFGILANNLIMRELVVAPVVTMIVVLFVFVPRLRAIRAERTAKVLNSARTLRGRKTLN
jgi:hypothetical protein